MLPQQGINPPTAVDPHVDASQFKRINNLDYIRRVHHARHCSQPLGEATRRLVERPNYPCPRTGQSNNSSTDQMWSVNPAAIAGLR